MSDEAGEPRKPLWLIARFGPQVSGQDCAFVRAEEEGEAARIGAWELDGLDDDTTSMEAIGSVYVVRITEGTWWEAIPDFVTQRAELQCCGGNKYTDHGHSGHCPVHRAQSS